MYVVISDTHIGDRQANKNLPVLFNFLEKLDKNITLVLNGDIIDFSKTFYFDERHRIFLRIIQKFNKVIYIEGNHDWFVSGLKDVFPKLIFKKQLLININSKLIRIFHGHTLDFFCSKFPRFVRSMTIFSDWVYKYTGINFQGLFYKHIQKYFLKMKARKITRLEMCANIIITGHTHFPQKMVINNVDFYNSGDWLDSKNTACVIIDDTGEIKLKLIGKENG